ELGHDIGTSRELRDVLLPLAEYFRAPAFVRTDSQRAAEVIEHDRRIRKRSGEIDHRRHLRMVLPRLEAETQAPQPGEAFSKSRRFVQIRGRVGVRIPDRRTRVEAARVPDATETRRRCGDMRLQYLFDWLPALNPQSPRFPPRPASGHIARLRIGPRCR